MKIANYYAGVGGNSLHWHDDEVTSIEYTEAICDINRVNHPNHQVLCCDAGEHLLAHYTEYDLIWASPPCQGNSRMIRSGKNRKPRFPDLTLYEWVLFLQHNYKGLWVVENVVPYYEPVIAPSHKIGRHLFWSNFDLAGVAEVKQPDNFINLGTLDGMRKIQDWLGVSYHKSVYYEGNHDPAQIYRNAVHPDVGLAIRNKAQIAFDNANGQG